MEIVIGNRNVSAASTFTRGHMLREVGSPGPYVPYVREIQVLISGKSEKRILFGICVKVGGESRN